MSGRADAQPVADADRILEEALRRQVLAESAPRQLRVRKLVAPESVVL